MRENYFCVNLEKLTTMDALVAAGIRIIKDLLDKIIIIINFEGKNNKK